MRTWTTIDRVLSMEEGKSARGLRNVPNTLSILDSHFPRFPVLPGVLILGSMGELAALLLEKQTGRSWRMTRAEQIRFRRYVQPGDQMELTVELKEFSPEAAVLSGTVRVDNKPVTTARQITMAPRETGAGQ
jgi:3-hydroxyacyl-[acyl-carrier-protein] dehydratase